MDIILASLSKRRSSILSSCGIRHKVIPSRVKETMKGRSPSRIAIINAEKKAKSVAGSRKSGYIIGADTVVLLNKKVVGKPKSASHAKSMLRKMSGKAISVYTGLSVVDARTQKRAIGYKKSIVRVRKINSREISRIFSLLGPYDKAGGFSIEGAGSFIFDNIKGSYFNVLGLPTALLRDLFSRLGFDLLRCVKKI